MTKGWLSLGEVTDDQEGAGEKGKEETHLLGTKLGASCMQAHLRSSAE